MKLFIIPLNALNEMFIRLRVCSKDREFICFWLVGLETPFGIVLS